MGKIREPKKVTSIEKKNKIIEAGLVAFCDKGFYNTTTPDIAKIAGVSTGIIYSYFKDKKDIFLQSLDLYFEKLYSPLIKKIESAKFNDLKKTMNEVIDLTIKSHRENATAHEEMVAMSHLDHDVHEKFMNAEQKLVDEISKTLYNNGLKSQSAPEKVHIAYNLVENLCHEYVFHKHNFIDYNKMREETISVIEYIFKN